MILQSELPDLLSVTRTIRNDGALTGQRRYRPGLVYRWDDGTEARVYSGHRYSHGQQALDEARAWATRERAKYGLDD